MAATDAGEGELPDRHPFRRRWGWVLELLHPNVFPDQELRLLCDALREWGKDSGLKASDGIERWLLLDASERFNSFDCLVGGILNADYLPNGNLRHAKKFDESFVERQTEVGEALAMAEERRKLLELGEFLTSALELGRVFFRRWEEAKAREGLLDFDDLIRKAATVLKNSTASDWIRYKLDRSFDHVLIDEAQDTNRAQWDIVHAVIDDYFIGEGARGDKLRTIFTVGDYKQAIFGFQGTSPENFERAKRKVHKRIEAAKANAQAIRANRRLPTWQDLELGLSYRTSPNVLDFVNRVIEKLGFPAFGLKKAPEPHKSSTPDLRGLVTLWDPVTVAADEDEEEGASAEEGRDDADHRNGEERGWLPKHDTVLAEKIADQVYQWIYGPEPFVLEKVAADTRKRGYHGAGASAGGSRSRDRGQALFQGCARRRGGQIEAG